jgi:kynureninase
MPTATASHLDAVDPLARFRSRFVAADDPSIIAYLDGNSLGRPLVATGERLAAFVAGEWGHGLIRSWDEPWMAEPVTVGDRLAEVVLGAAPGQAVVADSTSVLLYKLMRAGIGARPGRDEVLIDRDNFPTDRFVMEGVAAECGLSVRYLSAPRDSGVRPADVASAVSERTALVVLSHVAYRSGFIADMAAITRAAHDAGALMLWDLCHSAGVVPVELDAGDVDLATGCTYKYLNGGPGSPAFCYVAARLQEELRQPIWGWMGASDPFAMGPAYLPSQGIRKFISGTPPVLAMQPLKYMVELIAEAGLAAVREKSVALTEHAIALADEVLAPLGARLASPRAAAERGSHITVDHESFAAVTAALWQGGVIPDFRPPDGIRIGLSPLSTSFAELERGVEAIAREMRALAGAS